MNKEQNKKEFLNKPRDIVYHIEIEATARIKTTKKKKQQNNERKKSSNEGSQKKKHTFANVNKPTWIQMITYVGRCCAILYINRVRSTDFYSFAAQPANWIDRWNITESAYSKKNTKHKLFWNNNRQIYGKQIEESFRANQKNKNKIQVKHFTKPKSKEQKTILQIFKKVQSKLEKSNKSYKMFTKSSEKYLLIVSVVAIMMIDSCYSSTFITPPITHPGKFSQPFYILFSFFSFVFSSFHPLLSRSPFNHIDMTV